MASKRKPNNYLIEWKQDDEGRFWWMLTNEASEEVAGRFTDKRQAIEHAIDITAGRGGIKVRDPETGQWTEESR